MFNGIIFNQGKIIKLLKKNKGANLYIESNLKVNKKDLGISISCDGVCLTLVSIKKKILEFYLSKETLNKSKFSLSKVGDKINLELPLKYAQKISGHFCQGHVDTVAILNSIKKYTKSSLFDFSINRKIKNDLVEKGSILINGVSLTISKVTKKGFQVWIIPHTLKLTNLFNIKKRDLVNIEIDILSKYVKRYFNEKK